MSPSPSSRQGQSRKRQHLFTICTETIGCAQTLRPWRHHLHLRCAGTAAPAAGQAPADVSPSVSLDSSAAALLLAVLRAGELIPTSTAHLYSPSTPHPLLAWQRAGEKQASKTGLFGLMQSPVMPVRTVGKKPRSQPELVKILPCRAGGAETGTSSKPRAKAGDGLKQVIGLKHHQQGFKTSFPSKPSPVVRLAERGVQQP